jgi:hypothetical protein
MRLPTHCLTCGGDAQGGRRLLAKRDYYPRWVWAGIVVPFPPIIMLILCIISRKPIAIYYSRCPACERAERRRMWTATGLWALTVAGLLASVFLDDAWILIPSALLLGAAITRSLTGNVSLRVKGYAGGVFTVKGTGVGFPGSPGDAVAAEE